MITTLPLAALDFGTVMPFAIFGLFAVGAWLVLDLVSRQKSRAEDRLDEFRDPKLRRRKEEEAKRKTSDAMTNMLRKATPALARPLQPKNESDAGKLRLKLMQAGFRSEAAPTMFLGLKFVCLIIGLIIGGGMMLITSHFNGTPIFSQSSLFKAVGIAGVMFYAPSLLLMFLTKRRKEQIFLGLPDALDLLVVCVEAGLGLDQAMRKVADEMKKSHRVIAEEFSISNLHVQMGRSRNQVLQELGQRSGVEDLRALASILIQADKFGSSIAQALRVQSDAMRVRRRQIAEEKAAKTAVKLIFPLVMFIFPGIFVVLVGPAAITMVREMFPAMSGH
jgi:tight adherence protein C